jgi:hypothetical protein
MDITGTRNVEANICHSWFGLPADMDPPPRPYPLVDSDPYGTYPLPDMYPRLIIYKNIN